VKLLEKTPLRRWGAHKRRAVSTLAAGGLVALSSCGPERSFKVVPVPAWELSGQVFREAPAELSPSDRRAFEQGWRALMLDDLKIASERFERLSQNRRAVPAVESALGYVELRQGNVASAEKRFARALQSEPRSVAALVGLSQTALSAGREELAFERLRALENVSPSNALVARYLPPLRLRLAESKLQEARRLRQARSYREASAKYNEAFTITPEATGLDAEVAEVELMAGEADRAAQYAKRALETEGGNGSLWALYGDSLKAQGQLTPAVEAYAKARTLLPSDAGIQERFAQARAELDRETVPPEYLSIADSERLTREQLAALLAVKLHDALSSAPRRTNVIATDANSSWARDYIQSAVAAGLLDVFPNHTFQPRAYVRKGELALALQAALAAFGSSKTHVIGTSEPDPLMIADVPRDHVTYTAVAQAVTLGLLPVDTMDRFEPLRFVSGQEGVEAVDALSRKVTP